MQSGTEAGEMGNDRSLWSLDDGVLMMMKMKSLDDEPGRQRCNLRFGKCPQDCHDDHDV